MDMQKIGKFLAELRREKKLTQEQLGERLGVTNKTISRWETGTYLPPVEMLQLLSEFYNVSINEILCGERLNDEQYKSHAEENLAKSLSTSVFTVKEKKDYFKKKWLKDHVFELIVEIIALIASFVICAIFNEKLCFIIYVLSLVFAVFTRNRLAAYIEHHIYDNYKTNEKTSSEKNDNK